jgi:hypothetical protein
MKTPVRAALLAAALLATASANATPAAPSACGACAYLETFDSLDQVARAAVFAASCDQVVAAQSQGADAAKIAEMHTACVAVQSSMFDPLMLCGTGMFQCDSVEVVDAAVKSVLSTPVMMAAAAAAPAIPCDMCENGLPLLKALSPPECQKMMVGAVKDVLQKPCDGVCQAALGFACSAVIPAAENNPKFVCTSIRQTCNLEKQNSHCVMNVEQSSGHHVFTQSVFYVNNWLM